MGNDTSEWREKVAAAHDMVSALCLPRGSKGSCEWIMRIPADPENDPDLVITSGLVAAEKRIAELNAEIAKRDSWPVQATPEQRPVSVRFDCTARQFNQHFDRIDRALFDPEVIPVIMDYLADHAVIDTPADLPSDEALAERLHAAVPSSFPFSDVRSARIAQARAAKEMLAPWLREQTPQPETDATIPSILDLRESYIDWLWEGREKGEDRTGKPEPVWLYEQLTPWLRLRHIDAAELDRLVKVAHAEWCRPTGGVESTTLAVIKAIGFTVEGETHE